MPVARAVDSLPEEQRAVLLLVSVDDLTYAETARVLDIPIGPVMSRLSWGRERLARNLAADGPIPAAGPVWRRVK